MSMIYGIPSYHRPQCKTYHMLRAVGVSENSIVIGLNDPNDYAEYAKRMPEAHIIVNKGNSAAFNRNRLIEEINGECILLDDDITKICRNISDPGKKYGQLVQMNAPELDALFRNCFVVAKNIDAKIFGVSATTNQMVIAQRVRSWGEYTPDVMIQGTITGIVDHTVRFNEKYLMVEDYEVSCRLISKNGHTLRRNDVCAVKPKNGTNEGGLHERYANGEQRKWIDILCRDYGDIVKPNKEYTGVRIRL